MKKEQKKINDNFKTYLSLALVFGFVIGVLVVIFFGEYYFNKWYLERVASESDQRDSKIIIQSPEKVEVTQNIRTKEVIEQVQPATVSIYYKRKPGRDIISQIYSQDDLISYGVIITSDGWLASAGGMNKKTQADDIVVLYKQEMRSVSKKIVDPATGIWLLKIDGVDLPVVKFGSTSKASAGEQVVVINSTDVQITNLSSVKKYADDGALYSSEKFYKYFSLSNNDIYKGSAIVNFESDLLGLAVSGDGRPLVVPIDSLQKSIKLILRESNIQYPYLGVNFIDISASLGINDEFTKGLEVGALLYGRGSVRAINSDSPLYGRLSEGVIITKINEQEINLQTTLPELILDKKKGDEIIIEYVKEENKKESVKVKLK